MTTQAVEPSERSREILRSMVLRLKAETDLEAAEGVSAEDFVFDIVESILAAETEEDIFEAQSSGAESGKEFVNRPFLLTEENLRFMKSRLVEPGKLPFYALMDVTEIATGNEYTMTCGGISVVSVLFALREKGFLSAERYPNGRPLVLQPKDTASGFVRLEIQPFKLPEPQASGRKTKRG